MYGLLNYGSILLGLVAWAMPVAALATGKHTARYAAVSGGLCCVSLLFQLLYTQHLVDIRDWSAIEDTHYAVVLAAEALLLGTAGLNLLALLVTKFKKR